MNYLKYKINLSSGLIWNFQLFSVINQFFFLNITVGKSDLKCREINEILQKIYYFHIWEGGCLSQELFLLEERLYLKCPCVEISVIKKLIWKGLSQLTQRSNVLP